MSFIFHLIARSRSPSSRGLEDGLQTLDAAYRKQIAALAQARGGVSDLLAAEAQLGAEAASLAAACDRFRAAADDAKARGDEAARSGAHANAEYTASQRDRLLEQISELRRSRLTLESMLEKVRMRIELFRTEKLASGVRYVAARAATRSGMTVAGLAAETGDVVRLTEDARERSNAALRALGDAPPK